MSESDSDVEGKSLFFDQKDLGIRTWLPEQESSDSDDDLGGKMMPV